MSGFEPPRARPPSRRPGADLGPGHLGSASLQVSTRLPGATITVMDGRLRIVGAGQGSLLLGGLDPGLYEVEVDAASLHRRKHVRLAAGGHETVDFELTSFPCVAPLWGRDVDAQAARLGEAAADLGPLPTPGTAGLVVMLRPLPGAETPEAEAPELRLLPVDDPTAPTSGAGRRLELTGGRDGTAVAATVLPAGPHALAFRARATGLSALGETWVGQSLWLIRGRLHYLVVPWLREGARPQLAVLHTSVPTRPWDAAAALEAESLELGYAWLRLGIDRTPTADQAAVDDPMLALLDAMLGGPGVTARRWPELTGMLGPDHPDLIALGTGTGALGVPLRTPPMLAANYRRALATDADVPELIPEGSAAEAVAARQVHAGIWTTWLLDPRPDRPGSDLYGFDVVADQGPDRGWMDDTPGEPRTSVLDRSPAAHDPARDRVDAFVEVAAQVAGISPRELRSRMDPRDMARRVNLPVATVQRVLGEEG